MSKHLNNGDCPKCEEIIKTYPSFYSPMYLWFKHTQKQHPECHTSCAGRGLLQQEEEFKKKASRAHFGESAHNWNCALDLFEMQGDTKNIYEKEWFSIVITDAVENAKSICGEELNWYGREGAPFHELPHVEPLRWKTYKGTKIVLVEPLVLV